MTYPDNIGQCHLGFIGAGNMTTAMVAGFIKSGQIKADQISVSAPSANNLTKFQKMGCHTTYNNNELFQHLTDNSEAKSRTKLVFLCVKPNIFKSREILNAEELERKVGDIVVVSVMAGITISYARDKLHLTDPSKCVRLMPNTATTVSKGICGLAIDDTLGRKEQEELKAFLIRVLSLIGLCEFVTEHQINAVCGLGGSGIAFVYSLIHAMSDGGLKMGLSRSVATNFAAQTVLGAAQMVLETGRNPGVLREEVTSPGGTTIHGLHALERGGFHSTVMDAVEAATKRADELS